MLVLDRFLTTPDATFGMLLAGRYDFFTQEPPLDHCLPSGVYPVTQTVEGGKTYMLGNGDLSIMIASRPTVDPLSHLFLGYSLGIIRECYNPRRGENGKEKQLFVSQGKAAFQRFLQRMEEVEKSEITIRWLGET